MGLLRSSLRRPTVAAETGSCAGAQVPAADTYYMKMIDIIGVESSVIICDEEANKELLMPIAEPHLVD